MGSGITKVGTRTKQKGKKRQYSVHGDHPLGLILYAFALIRVTWTNCPPVWRLNCWTEPYRPLDRKTCHSTKASGWELGCWGEYSTSSLQHILQRQTRPHSCTHNSMGGVGQPLLICTHVSGNTLCRTSVVILFVFWAHLLQPCSVG